MTDPLHLCFVTFGYNLNQGSKSKTSFLQIQFSIAVYLYESDWWVVKFGWSLSSDWCLTVISSPVGGVHACDGEFVRVTHVEEAQMGAIYQLHCLLVPQDLQQYWRFRSLGHHNNNIWYLQICWCMSLCCYNIGLEYDINQNRNISVAKETSKGHNHRSSESLVPFSVAVAT